MPASNTKLNHRKRPGSGEGKAGGASTLLGGGAIAAFVELTSKVSIEENIRTGAKSLEAKQITRERVAENVREVLHLAGESNSSPVEAAHYLAYQRIFSA